MITRHGHVNKRQGNGHVRGPLLFWGAALDWAGSWWGFALADEVPFAVWPVGAALPVALAVGAILWRRWLGWILFASASVGTLAQIGHWGWRIGVALVELAGATLVAIGLLQAWKVVDREDIANSGHPREPIEAES